MATTVATGIRGPRTRDLIISSSQACAQAHSVAFELWPRLAPRRHCAELLEQTKHVNQRPVLDDLPGGVETVDVDQLEGGLFAGRGEARELAVMGSGAFHPAHGFVTLGDLVFNDSVEVGKGSANLGDKLPHAIDARSKCLDCRQQCARAQGDPCAGPKSSAALDLNAAGNCLGGGLGHPDFQDAVRIGRRDHLG